MIALLDADTPIWMVALIEWFDNLLRYLLVAVPGYLIFWVWGRERFRSRLIQGRYPRSAHLKREVLYSMSTALVFGAVGTLMYYASLAGVTRLYLEPGRHGYLYLAASTGILIVLQDAYFYWTHRAMHHPVLYARFHRAHHRSTNPSPWAAYAFAPGEALVHAVFVPLTALWLPLHPIAIAAFLVFMIFRNVWGHLGMEFLPAGFARHPFWGWNTTTTHHSLHHSDFRSNYGLYFTWWDRWLATTHVQYEATFERVATQVQPARSGSSPIAFPR